MKGLPPSYPRIPHLAPSDAATRDDRLLSAPTRDVVLFSEIAVEEKLDGSNVTLWLNENRGLECAGRSGPGAMDRGGQLGRLRAWASEHHSRVGAALAEADILYGEWLWLRHSVFYDRLPSFLVVLDLASVSHGLLPLTERNRLCRQAGLATPPCLFTGVPGTLEALFGLCGQSRFGHEAMEGLVVRDASSGPVAKLLAPGFRRKSDEEWRKARVHNELAPPGEI
ncbi:MAG: RNA ligase family protein [Candidatus Geothermincolia bacterium]